MNLPAPNLDDRRFQDLVDDAKRMVALKCPEWSDHNVSDPGVTLIEAFAFMTDELLYRLNRVPDKLYVAFLDLIGVTLFPPTNATADVVFWLSAPREEPVVVPARTEVGTPRTELSEPIVFSTLERLEIPPRSLHRLGSARHDAETVVRTARVGAQAIDAFAETPAPGDALLLGLDRPAGDLAISLRLDCEVRGLGINPDKPPIRWEAWTGDGWAACDVVSDGTRGLNRVGDVVVIVPRDHAASVQGGERASWLRARLIETPPKEPTYTASPHIRSITARTAGAVTAAIHAETVEDEILGLSEGVSGQQFALARRPVIDDGDLFEVEVGRGGTWETWTEVRHGFADQPEDATMVWVDRSSGIVHFPPAVREPKAPPQENGSEPTHDSETDAPLQPNGSRPSEEGEPNGQLQPNGSQPAKQGEPDAALRHYGAVPPKGAPLRVRRYRIGGGARGNVSPRALSTLRTTVPFVRGCENRSAAHGGVDGETLDEAKIRGPLTLRALDRAVTLEDYEHLAKQAAPGIARVEAVAAVGPDADYGVRVLVVPTMALGQDGRLAYHDLIPSADVLRLIAEDLDARRTVGTRVSVERPSYKGVTIVARLIARPRVAVEPLHKEALAALYRWFDPARGGADGRGWPLGRSVLAGEVYSVLQSLHGVEFIEDLQLFEADPDIARRGEPAQRIHLQPDELVFGFAHSIRVTAGI